MNNYYRTNVIRDLILVILTITFALFGMCIFQFKQHHFYHPENTQEIKTISQDVHK